MVLKIISKEFPPLNSFQSNMIPSKRIILFGPGVYIVQNTMVVRGRAMAAGETYFGAGKKMKKGEGKSLYITLKKRRKIS